ncbi:MAG: ABC transporter permease [Leptospirales bacterium]
MIEPSLYWERSDASIALLLEEGFVYNASYYDLMMRVSVYSLGSETSREMLIAAWSYRYFILSSIKVEFRARFSRSKLGGAWMIFNPLAQVGIYALVLSHLMSSKIPGTNNNKFAYVIYLMAGTLSWSLFSEIVTRCLTIFIDNANLLKKMVFPKICLPFIVFGSALVNNLLLFLAISLVFLALGHWPSLTILWLPLLILMTAMLAIGFGLLLGVLNVFIRDIGQIVPILLQFGFWLTPIVYIPDMLPESYRHLFQVNPMYVVVSSYHDVLVFGRAPEFSPLLLVGILIVFLMIMSFFLFRKASPEMVDVL